MNIQETIELEQRCRKSGVRPTSADLELRGWTEKAINIFREYLWQRVNLDNDLRQGIINPNKRDCTTSYQVKPAKDRWNVSTLGAKAPDDFEFDPELHAKLSTLFWVSVTRNIYGWPIKVECLED